MRKIVTCIAFVFALACIVGPAPASACFIGGTISAAQVNDANSPFDGMWKYTIDFTWDTSSGLSHTNIYLGLENMECVCDPGLFAFEDPAGTSDGEDCLGGTIPVEYTGEYVCKGDPSIPAGMDKPAVKFDAKDDPDCEPAMTGSGTVCFYSVFPPAPFSVDPTGMGVKAGTMTCFGDLSGTAPWTDCSVSTETSTWGLIKATYK